MQDALIRLVVAWTLVGALIFTVVATCASLVGWLKFKDASQQRKMFYVLIVQLAVVGVTFFGNILKYDPAEAADDVVKLGNYDYWKSFHHDGVAGIDKPGSFPDEYLYAENNLSGKIKYYPKLNVFIETNKLLNYPAYHYYFRPIKVEEGFLVVYDDSRGFALKLPLKSGMSYFSGSGGNGNFTPFHMVVAM